MCGTFAFFCLLLHIAGVTEGWRYRQKPVSGVTVLIDWLIIDWLSLHSVYCILGI